MKWSSAGPLLHRGTVNVISQFSQKGINDWSISMLSSYGDEVLAFEFVLSRYQAAHLLSLHPTVADGPGQKANISA